MKALALALVSLTLVAQQPTPRDAQPDTHQVPELKSHAADTPASDRETLLKMLTWDIRSQGKVKDPQNPDHVTWEFHSGTITNGRDGQQIAFSVHIFGASPNAPWDIIVWPLGAPTPAIQYHGVWINHRGVAFRDRIPDEGQQADGGEGSIGFRLGGAKGEPTRYLLLSADRKTAIHGVSVPFPNITKQGKCAVELRLASKDGRMLLVFGTGFPAAGLAHMATDVDGKLSEQDLKTDDHGNFQTGLLPPAGIDNGTRKLTFTAPSCTVTITQAFGPGSYQPQ